MVGTEFPKKMAIWGVATVLLIASGTAIFAQEDDRALEPCGAQDFKALQYLSEWLDFTPNEMKSLLYARMLVLPSFEPEWVVSLYLDLSTVPEPGWIEVTEAQERIWPITRYEESNEDEAVPKVPTWNWRAHIPRTVADIVQKAFTREMLRARFPSERPLSVDGVRFTYIAQIIGSGEECGALDNAEDHTLTKLASSLVEYAKASDEDRLSQLDQILALADAIP